MKILNLIKLVASVLKVIKFLNKLENIEEQGTWQVIVGRHYIASFSFDARELIYFLFDDIQKYFLVFRS